VSGVAPQLAALVMLLYPNSSLVIANTTVLAAGTIEILPPEGPLTLLVCARHGSYRYGWKAVHHRGGVRSGAEPDPGEGRALATGAVVQRPAFVRSAGLDRVVVAAVVVAMPGAVAAAHLVAVDPDAAGAALDQGAQHPLARLGAPRAPLAVVTGDPGDRLERRFVHYGRNGDRDPLVAGAGICLVGRPGPDCQSGGDRSPIR